MGSWFLRFLVAALLTIGIAVPSTHCLGWRNGRLDDHSDHVKRKKPRYHGISRAQIGLSVSARHPSRRYSETEYVPATRFSSLFCCPWIRNSLPQAVAGQPNFRPL